MTERKFSIMSTGFTNIESLNSAHYLSLHQKAFVDYLQIINDRGTAGRDGVGTLLKEDKYTPDATNLRPKTKERGRARPSADMGLARKGFLRFY